MPMDQLVPGLRGQVVAFSNPSVEDWLRVLPWPLETLPRVVQLVLIGACDSDEDMWNKLRRATPAAIRGRVVIQWAKAKYA
eukprot:32428-Eustigmatos_ZCMA.PRE.1